MLKLRPTLKIFTSSILDYMEVTLTTMEAFINIITMDTGIMVIMVISILIMDTIILEDIITLMLMEVADCIQDMRHT